MKPSVVYGDSYSNKFLAGMMAERSKALESGCEISSPKGREFESPSCQRFFLASL